MADLLSGDDLDLMRQIEAVHRRKTPKMKHLDSYHEGTQKVKHLGLAIPPALRDFETVINIPRMAVSEPERRQNLKSFLREGSSNDDPALREAYNANNLSSQLPLLQTDEKIFGHAFITVGVNEDDAEHPLIRVEDPRAFACVVDPRTRAMRGAARFVRDLTTGRRYATLMQPYKTQQLIMSGSGWEVEDLDEHGLERTPAVLFLNRPRTGEWLGGSEMADVIPLTDSIARLVTNMTVAAETHAVPSRWAAGVTKGDFLDPKTGKPLETWDAYFTAIMTATSADAKFGQFTAGDLKNFHEAVNNMFAWCAALLGLPTRYAGQQSVNPATEGAIRADEARLVSNVERMNDRDGDSMSWVMGLYERIRTKEWPARNSIRTTYLDPATPTRAQAVDAAVKLRSEGLISREGVWDELGWGSDRQELERQRLEREAQDPVLVEAIRGLNGGSVDDSIGVSAGVQDEAGV